MNELFYTSTPNVDASVLAAKYKNGIEAKDAMSHIGKTVMVCSRVYGIKTTDKVTFINVGDKYPKSPLTVVIFAKDRKNFLPSIEELYNDKYICVQGTIVEYQGKAEILIEKPQDIIIQKYGP